jgi:hypothetical protein
MMAFLKIHGNNNSISYLYKNEVEFQVPCINICLCITDLTAIIIVY